MKKKVNGYFFYEGKLDQMSKRSGKSFDQNFVSSICYEMLVYGSLGRKGDNRGQLRVSCFRLLSFSKLFHFNSNVIVPGVFLTNPSEGLSYLSEFGRY